jgi:hypothetical protein
LNAIETEQTILVTTGMKHNRENKETLLTTEMERKNIIDDRNGTRQEE